MRIILVLAALTLLPACDRTPGEPQATVEQAVVSLPAIPGRPGAAYFQLATNHQGTRLVSIQSPLIGRIELHESVEENGISRMVTLYDVRFGPDEKMIFEPGGRHAMLFEIDPQLRPGNKVMLKFNFDPAPAVTVEAEVRAAGGGGHSGH